MRLKKRTIFLACLLVLFFLSRCGSLQFREDDKKQRQQIMEKVSMEPVFMDYEVAERTMHCTQVGDESAPLVILVHGSPGSSSAYMDYLTDTVLTKQTQLIAVDRPGFGFSDFGTVEVSLDMQAAYLKPILEKYRSVKTILVGHSYGGPVIVKMAMDYPDLVDGLVIVAGSVAADLEPREWWRPVINFPLIRWLIPPSLKVSNQEIQPLWEELEKIESSWNKITCPVTIFQGELDNLVPKGNAEYAAKMLVNSAEVKVNMIAEGDHFILWSKRAAIVEGILALIKLVHE